MGGRSCFRGLVFIALSTIIGLSGESTFAFVQSTMPSGVGLRWKGSKKYNLAGNSRNISGVSSDSFFEATVRGLQRWKSASLDALQFDYWQGENPSVYLTNSDYNGLSSIYFASQNSASSELVDSGVIGMTQVWFDTSSGEILEADIVLNDKDFRFSLDPRKSSGQGAPDNGVVRGEAVFIENVITHEMGHAFGLSHSGVLQSTMLFLEAPEQARLSCDEFSAIRALYPTSLNSSLGSIHGEVVSNTAYPVKGAHVLAISKNRGTVVASAITNSTGNYELASLESGDYFIMVEPFYAGASSLPENFSGINHRFCGGRFFARTFLTEQDGASLKPISPGQTAPRIVLQCSESGGAAVGGMRGGGSLSTAPIIDGTQDFALIDQKSVVADQYYRLTLNSGEIELRGLSHSLYSPLQMRIALLDSWGVEIASQTVSPVYSGTSGYKNRDFYLKAVGLSAGEYFIRVSGISLSNSYFPAGDYARDQVPFFVLIGRRNSSLPPLEDSLAYNPRCSEVEDFSEYKSPGGHPPRRFLDHVPRKDKDEDEDEGLFGFCGQMQRNSGNSNGPIPPGQVLGWFLPWLAMAFSIKTFGLRRKLRYH